MVERIEVKSKTAAEKAIKAGKPIKIVGGAFYLAVANLTGVDIQIGELAQVQIELSNVEAIITQTNKWTSHVVARGTSHVVARGNSHVEAWESSHVVAWGNSHVVARGNSHVEAWGNSHVVARGTSHVVARGFTMIQAKSSKTTLTASESVSVNLWNGAMCDGGRQYTVVLKTPQDWCDFYGVKVENNQAIVYKAVGKDYVSYHGVAYLPGTLPEDPAWNGSGQECSAGGGLNFSPSPSAARRFVTYPEHYLECRVNLDEMIVHFDGTFPEKIQARRVAAPLIEVDKNSKPI